MTNNQLYFEDIIRENAKEIAELVISKQKDYGKGNILNSVIDPKLAIAVRLQDKVARLANLSLHPDSAKNESLKDTANDIVGYGLLLGMVIDETFEYQMKD